MGTIHIIPDEDQERPIDETGVFFVEGARPIEYHCDPENISKTYHPKGRTTAGDVGYSDGKGYLYMTYRNDFMIISEGGNIYPQAAEHVPITHPRVMDVAVIGVPNEDRGE